MKRTPQIEMDTPILPHVIAEAVRQEASAWLGQPLPRRWVRELNPFPLPRSNEASAAAAHFHLAF